MSFGIAPFSGAPFSSLAGQTVVVSITGVQASGAVGTTAAVSSKALTGVDAAGAALDGENVAPVLLGKSEASRGAPIFWRRPPDRKTASPSLPERLPDLAMREGSWKLLCEYDGTKPQLYDLSRDRGETNNVASANAGVVERMTRALLAWHQSMPPDNGPALGAEVPAKKEVKRKAGAASR